MILWVHSLDESHRILILGSQRVSDLAYQEGMSWVVRLRTDSKHLVVHTIGGTACMYRVETTMVRRQQ